MALEVVKIPISEKVYRGVKEVELSDFNYELIDGYSDALGGTRKRPGLLQALDLGTEAPADGLFKWRFKNFFFSRFSWKAF